MTIDTKHRNPCLSGKRRYLDGRSAYAALQRTIPVEKKKKGQKLEIYQCPFPDCRLWHIGHSGRQK